MHISDFDYVFPEELIASEPLPERSGSRLLCLDAAMNAVAHSQFKAIVDLINPEDLLVFNDTKVIPARLYGKKSTGGQVEFLITQILDATHASAWARSSKPIQLGTKIFLDQGIEAEVLDKQGDEFTLQFTGLDSIDSILQAIGHMPLPPYLHRPDQLMDQTRYQTIYAKHQGAIAAPTAGLHFDAPLLSAFEDKGIQKVHLTLHVGIGTFQPVRVENIEEHKMHQERIIIPEEVCEKIKETKARKGRVIAVGTTVVRSLEAAAVAGELKPFSGKTAIFIYPGFKFKVVDALITNLHLPRSTLLMLVCAFAGRDAVLSAYQEAVEHRYRFFSYGDAMFITRRES